MGRARPARARSRRPQRRRPPRRQHVRRVPRHGADRSRPDAGRAQRRRGGRPFRGDPRPGLRPEGETFRINALSTYNVFAAAVTHRPPARRVGVERDGARVAVRHAAGLRADRRDDRAATRSRPTRCRSSSARRWPPSSPVGTRSGSSACASRTSWRRPTTPPSPRGRTTRRSGAGTCGATSTRATWRRRSRLGLESDIVGSEIAIIAAADTTMLRPSAELMAEVFPNVPLRRPVEGRGTLLAIDHARRLLGYEPAHRWQDHVST